MSEKCSICGRFMRRIEFFTDDRLGGFEENWGCDNHDFEEDYR